MVSQEAKEILTYTPGVDPKDVANFTGDTERACWNFLIALEQRLNEFQKNRDEGMIRSQARDWAEQLPEAYETKRLILLERLRTAETETEKEERLKHYRVFTGKVKTFTPQEIERARDYPLKDLLDTNKNIAKCPFHDDKTASMNIKNNYYHCHACNITGDSIDFVMKRDDITFREAVLKLQ